MKEIRSEFMESDVPHPKLTGEWSKPSFEATPLVEGKVWKVDVRSLLEREHPSWESELMDVARVAPEKTIEGGSVRTSLAPPGFHTLYHPTNGLTIAREVPWLLSMYQNEFRDLVAHTTGDESVRLGEDLEHSLNMNLTKKGPYELHGDRNKYTGLLAVTTMHTGEGGELILWKDSIVADKPNISQKPDLLGRTDIVERLSHWETLELMDKLAVWREFELWKKLRPEDQLVVIRPEAGFLYIFNGREHLHEVTAVEREEPRLMIPGDYYTDTVHEVKDAEFNKKVGVSTDAA